MTISEQLESSIDIVDLVGRYTKLKKSGANYKAICPFAGHHEKTPSFVVSPSKQIAYCFGCHRWWWAIKFVMDIEWCDFRQSLEILSSITWVKLKWYDKETEKVTRNLYSLYKDINNFYISRLSKYDEMKNYLTDRWLTPESIEKFNLGFSDSWIELYNYLKEKWYEDNQIEESQVFLNLNTKKDKFIDRIIFPIKNQRWDTVAFAGRIVWSGEPKYLNSPATKIYDKSSILYWLFEWKSEVIKKDFIIIVEWYMDVISLHQAGYNNSVAVSGTALTDKHISQVKRFTKKIYLCFDSDVAGQKATKLALENLRNKEIEVRIISLKWWKDPDDIIKSWWNFSECIENAYSPMWYLIEELSKEYNLSSINDKKILLKILLDNLKSYSDNVEKDFYIKEISDKLDIPKETVYEEFSKIRQIIKKDESKVKKTIYSSQDLVIWYILDDQSLLDLFREKLVFREELSNILSNVLESGIEVIDMIDLWEKEKIKAISLHIEESLQWHNIESRKIEIDKLVEKVNLDCYKNIEKRINTLLKENPNSLEAFAKKNELIKIARERWFKK